MAQDDVISDSYVAISGSSTTEIVPASGDEWILTALHSAASTDIAIEGYDGSNNHDLEWSPIGAITTTTAYGIAYHGRRLALMITQTERLRFRNNNAGGRTAMYYGMKLKD